MKSRYKLKIKDYRLIYIPKWKIKGFDNYGFLEDKRLFNYKTNRFSKKVVRGYSVGFNLDGKFYTIKQMKDEKWVSLIEKSSNNNLNKKLTIELYSYLLAS